jgi:hypothetical protein
MKRELLYPFLIECCSFTNDRYWKNIFEDLAYGITPYGTYINKDFLTCNYKDKEFTYRIHKKDPKDIYEELISLFRKKLNMMSRDEILKKKNDITNNQKEIIISEWSNIKKKNLKEILIEKYAIEMSKKYNLNNQQTRYLVSVIFLSFIFKSLTSDDIILKDGKIENIIGITFEKGKVVMKKDIYEVVEINNSTSIIIDKAYMSDEWEKYLNNLRKMI